MGDVACCKSRYPASSQIKDAVTMKSVKLVLAVISTFVLATGTATAASFDINDIEYIDIGDGVKTIGNPPGVETDGTSVTQGVEGEFVDVWVAIEVTSLLDPFSSIKADASATNDDVLPALKTDFFDVFLYAADVVGDIWTTNPDPIADMLGDSLGNSVSPLEIGLTAGATYLLNFQGTLDVLDDYVTNWDYSVRISSVVPVPAAVWLFGTAMVGLLGIRRRKMAIAA